MKYYIIINKVLAQRKGVLHLSGLLTVPLLTWTGLSTSNLTILQLRSRVRSKL